MLSNFPVFSLAGTEPDFFKTVWTHAFLAVDFTVKEFTSECHLLTQRDVVLIEMAIFILT